MQPRITQELKLLKIIMVKNMSTTVNYPREPRVYFVNVSLVKNTFSNENVLLAPLILINILQTLGFKQTSAYIRCHFVLNGL